MKKQGLFSSIVIIVLLFIALILFGCNKLGLMFRTTINGTYLGFVNTKHIDDYVYDVLTETDYVFDNLDLDAETVTYTFVTNDVFANRSYLSYIKGLLVGNNYEFAILKEIDTNRVVSWLEEYNQTESAPVSAYIEKNDSFVIVPEVEGTMVDIDKLMDAISPYDYSHIVLSDYFVQPLVTTSDLQEMCDKANAYANWSCTYSNGATIKSNIDYVCIDDEHGIIYDDSFIENEIENVMQGYSDRPSEFAIVDHNGQRIVVPNGTLEAKVDIASEILALKQDMKTLVVETARIPCYLIDNNKLTNTYVEVSIGQQHLWYYENGIEKLDCGVVTGQVGKCDTPVGCYYISQKINGTYLSGDEYKLWVNYWMRITDNGIGLHDASWRQYFGGEIYETDGSHGCINMPNEKAYNLYSAVTEGTIVIIHQ